MCLMNLSMNLLVWLPGIKSFELLQKLRNVYIGNADYEGTANMGDYLYFQVSNSYSSSLLSIIRSNRLYIDEYDPDPESTMFIFKVDEKDKQDIVKPFIQGKYSEIDREYVKDNFPMYVGGNISTNWAILNKREEILKEWENAINVTNYAKVYIPEDAEVYSKPVRSKEIYNFDKLENVEPTKEEIITEQIRKFKEKIDQEYG